MNLIIQRAGFEPYDDHLNIVKEMSRNARWSSAAVFFSLPEINCFESRLITALDSRFLIGSEVVKSEEVLNNWIIKSSSSVGTQEFVTHEISVQSSLICMVQSKSCETTREIPRIDLLYQQIFVLKQSVDNEELNMTQFELSKQLLHWNRVLLFGGSSSDYTSCAITDRRRRDPITIHVVACCLPLQLRTVIL